MIRSSQATAAAAFAALALTAQVQAQADWFVGVQAGNAAADEDGTFGAPVPGFGGPTVDHDLCGGTAVITVGPQPQVTAIDANSTNYRVFVGARGEHWSLELSNFNVARLQGSADSGPYSVAQPTCNPVPTDPITVDAFGRTLSDVAFNGISLSPAYSLLFAEGWTIDFRANVAFWQRDDRSQWQIVVTENSNGVPIQTYPTTHSNGSAGGSGTDLGFGLGMGWQATEKMRLRLQLDWQPYSEFQVRSVTLGFAIDLGD